MMINKSFADRNAGHRTAVKGHFTRCSKEDRAILAELDYIASEVHHTSDEEFRMRKYATSEDEAYADEIDF